MSVFKRFKNKRIHHASPEWKKASWVAVGMCDGQRYDESLKKYNVSTRQEAEAAEAEIQQKIRSGEFFLFKDRTTFRQYVEEYYKPRVLVLNKTFGNNKKFQIERLVAYFADKELKKISRKSCEDYRAFRSSQTIVCQKCTKFKNTCYLCSGDKPRYKAPCWKCRKRIEAFEEHKRECRPSAVKNGTVNHDLKTLAHILSEAVKDKKLKESPMQFVSFLPEDEARNRILSLSEKDRLFAAFEDNYVDRRLWSIVLIAVTTVWRMDRIMRLKKEDLDYSTLSVRVGTSKQDKAKLSPVSPQTWSVLDAAAELVEYGYLFRESRTGKPLKRFPYDSWNALLERAGIEDLHFHDLRHQGATEMYLHGTHLFGIQNALGHKRITTTERYVSVVDESLRPELEKLGRSYEKYIN